MVTGSPNLRLVHRGAPQPGTAAHDAVLSRAAEALPLAFRLERTIAVVPVSPTSIGQALTNFDDVVRKIETCAIRERLSWTLAILGGAEGQA